MDIEGFIFIKKNKGEYNCIHRFKIVSEVGSEGGYFFKGIQLQAETQYCTKERQYQQPNPIGKSG